MYFCILRCIQSNEYHWEGKILTNIFVVFKNMQVFSKTKLLLGYIAVSKTVSHLHDSWILVALFSHPVNTFDFFFFFFLKWVSKLILNLAGKNLHWVYHVTVKSWDDFWGWPEFPHISPSRDDIMILLTFISFCLNKMWTNLNMKLCSD